jgi:hypothetical protein
MPQGPPKFPRLPIPPRGFYPLKPKKNTFLIELLSMCFYAFSFAGLIFFLVAFFYANMDKGGNWINKLFLWTVDLLRF